MDIVLDPGVHKCVRVAAVDALFRLVFTTILGTPSREVDSSAFVARVAMNVINRTKYIASEVIPSPFYSFRSGGFVTIGLPESNNSKGAYHDNRNHNGDCY